MARSAGFIAAIIVLATCANAQTQTTLLQDVEELWYSQNRGRIVFLDEPGGGSPPTLYVVSLPSFEVVFRSDDQRHPVSRFSHPRWDRTRRGILVRGEPPDHNALCRLDIETGKMLPLSAWPAGPAGQRRIPVHLTSASDVGQPFSMALSMPRFFFHDSELSVGPSSGTVYSIRSFTRRGLWPGGPLHTTAQISTAIAELDDQDSILYDEDNDRRYVIAIDSAGCDSILFRRPGRFDFGFQISTDERVFAFGDGYAVELFDPALLHREFLIAPEPICLKQFRFSPTDGTLAITSVPSHRERGSGEFILYTTSPPDYDSLHVLKILEGPAFTPPIWSPDGKWIVIQSGDREELFFEIIHVSSRRSFRTYREFTWHGEELERVGMGNRFRPGIGEFDWTTE